MNAVALRPVRLFIRQASRTRQAIMLALLLAACGDLLIRFSAGTATALVSLLDVVLIVVPLAALVLGTVQVHHAREITELLLAQPVTRRRLFVGLWGGTVGPVLLALAVGLPAPFLWNGLLGGPGTGLLLGVVAAALALAVVGNALAFVIALRIDDRVRALGVALVAWLVATVLWDGLVLLLALLWADRPIEGPLLALLALNPVDIARVLLLLGSDAAAMLGYTGAVLVRALGTTVGQATLAVLLLAWCAIPLWLAVRTFERKDF
jgi:Cu-processing system permease protein